MDRSQANLPADVCRIAGRIVDGYRPLGCLGFAYGQGSTFSGFSPDADLDIVLIWARATPPPREVRPFALLCDQGCASSQFDEGMTALDKLWVDGRQVDVAHHTMQSFDRWRAEISDGDGWQGDAWPLPIFATSGFFYGVLLEDLSGTGAVARASLSGFPDLLVRKTHETLARTFPIYRSELAACVRRGDEWLFHELLCKFLRDIYVAWFAAERHYCPHPKRLHHWVGRFQMDATIAGTERAIWETPDLERKLQLVTVMIEGVLRLNRTTLVS